MIKMNSKIKKFSHLNLILPNMNTEQKINYHSADQDGGAKGDVK